MILTPNNRLYIIIDKLRVKILDKFFSKKCLLFVDGESIQRKKIVRTISTETRWGCVADMWPMRYLIYHWKKSTLGLQLLRKSTFHP